MQVCMYQRTRVVFKHCKYNCNSNLLDVYVIKCWLSFTTVTTQNHKSQVWRKYDFMLWHDMLLLSC